MIVPRGQGTKQASGLSAVRRVPALGVPLDARRICDTRPRRGAHPQLVYHRVHLAYGKACYAVFLMIFVASGLEFPDEWYLQPLFFLLPIVGLGAIADSVVRLAYLVFTRSNGSRSGNAWSPRSIVTISSSWGWGRSATRSSRACRARRERRRHRQGRPVAVAGRLLRPGRADHPGERAACETLEQAGVKVARAVIMATSDDLTNLDGGLTARPEPECPDCPPPLRRVAGGQGDRRLHHPDDLDVPGRRARVHRRGDRAEGVPGVPPRRSAPPPDRPDHRARRHPRRLDRRHVRPATRSIS